MMKTKHYMALAAMTVVAMSSCTGNGEKTVSGIDITDMDTTVAPGTDFFQYACGGWNEKHPLTEEYSRYGSFEMLAENNQKQLHDLIEEVAQADNAPGSAGQKIGDLFAMAMDSVKLNVQGYDPIKAQLGMIASMTDKSQIAPMIIELFNNGVGTYFVSGVGADPMNSSLNIFQLAQGGLNLGEKEYYLDNDTATVSIRNSYKQYIETLFRLVGCSASSARAKMHDVMEIETEIAKVSLSAAELRDPMANYHKMSYDELKSTVKGIDWDAYTKGLGIDEVGDINIAQIVPIQKVGELIQTMPLSKHISYLQFNLIDAAASFMSDDFFNAKFEFWGKQMSGKQAPSPRWKRAVNVINGSLGELVGQLYVERYFPAAAKERMMKLVQNLQVALGERIQAQEWMSDDTKMKAMEKLDAFHVKIGYPDKWKDYSELEIKKDSYWANICRASQWGMKDMISRLGKPVDRDEWLMSPQTINAYYNPTTNEICFPAAILQKPFFDMNADDAVNYGAIGVVIGHEMTHGFDDQGRQFDKDGNLRNWWGEKDVEGFNKRAQVMVDFFNNIEVLPGLNGNGLLTLGENLADHGGLNVSFAAFKNATKDHPLPVIDGFTPEQRFFLSNALIWAGNIREQQIRNLTKSDPHSLGKWRVNGALPHIQAWYDAFNITPEDPMYIAPENRVNLW